MQIFWSNKTSNHDHLQQCKNEDLETSIMRRKRKWIGCIFRIELQHITQVGFCWAPERKRRCGQPRQTWWRTAEGEITRWMTSWESLRSHSCGRDLRRAFVVAPHASRPHSHDSLHQNRNQTSRENQNWRAMGKRPDWNWRKTNSDSTNCNALDIPSRNNTTGIVQCNPKEPETVRVMRDREINVKGRKEEGYTWTELGNIY